MTNKHSFIAAVLSGLAILSLYLVKTEYIPVVFIVANLYLATSLICGAIEKHSRR